jgi:hypothetical protein
MKKFLLVAVFSLSFSSICFSQTWVESAGQVNEHEYTVITKAQFDRLLEQYRGRFSFAEFSYRDVLEARNRNNVIEGTRPRLNGYYYLMGTRFSIVSQCPFLVYGNSSTGRMYIIFPPFMTTLGRSMNGIRTNSNEFTNRYNQHIRWVNGE